VALATNEQYDVTEPKRLPPSEIERVRAAIRSLE
jgi:hypothetical protein